MGTLISSGILLCITGKRSETRLHPRLSLSRTHHSGASKLQNGVLQQVNLPSGFSDENFVALLSNQGQQRRRRFPNGGSSGRLTRRHSLREDVEHAAAETYLITRLTFKLLRYLGIGYRWIVKFMALGFYALFLMPGFLQIGWYYFFSGKVHRSIEYGDQPRNRLDLYIPEKVDKPLPAVAFVTGGAWIIGYKAWGSLLGQQLVDRDIIVACIDYRNFPQGRIGDMVKDVTTGISFFCNTIAEYGGDPDRLYLAGQSAGAHISTCALLEQARKEALEGPQSVTWSASQFKCFFGLSGGYNLPELIDHFHRRGLYRSIFLSVMEGEDSLEKYSPEMVVQSSEFRTAVPLLPPLVLFHGTADYSIPYDESVIFADALQSVNAKVSVKLYDDKTHTDLILQDPMRGGRDELLADILEVIHAEEEEELAIDRSINRPRMVPEILLQLARKVSPF